MDSDVVKHALATLQTYMDQLEAEVSATWAGAWLLRRFLGAYEIVARLPDTCPIGYVTTYIAALIMMPVILYYALCMIWSLAKVGPARKSMTTFFILFLGVPLYPILTAVVLAILWFVLDVAGIVLVTLGPVFIVAVSWCGLADYKAWFVSKQRSSRARSEDITCTQLLLGLFMGIFCLCTVGLCAFLSTLIKSPLVLLSGFCQAWYRGVKAWLQLVRCSWCAFSRRPLTIFGQEQDSTDDSDDIRERRQACTWWYWFPLVIVAWLVFIALGVCVAVLVIIVSALVKLLASAIWPAYVTSGWLRFFGGTATRRRDNSCCTVLTQGFKAGYQVLWASDVLTNLFIVGDLELFAKAFGQFYELAEGRRDELDADCRRLSCLPPVFVGIFGSSWDLAAQAMAKKLGIGKNDVEEAWRSLARQMILIGRKAIEDQLITKDSVNEIPAWIVIGLPARTMLDTLERSPQDEIVLSSGIVLKNDDRPRGTFFDTVWTNLMSARDARAAVTLSDVERDSLCAALLAGGGDADDLPAGLAAATQNFERLPADKLEACRRIVRPLIAVSVECSRKDSFKEKLTLTIEGITAENDAAYVDILNQSVQAERERSEQEDALSGSDSSSS